MAAKSDTLMQIASDDFVEAESKISENTNLVTQKDANHRSILHWASVMGKERLVEFLLTFQQCQIDEPDDTGKVQMYLLVVCLILIQMSFLGATPLILATLNGSIPICTGKMNHRLFD